VPAAACVSLLGLLRSLVMVGRILPLLLPLALLASSCRTTTPEQWNEQVHEALEAGDPQRALQLLHRAPEHVTFDPALRVEALLRTGDSTGAFQLVDELATDDPARATLLHDTCASAAMVALADQETDLVRAHLARCDGMNALDLYIFGLHADVLDGETPDLSGLQRTLRQLRRAPPGPDTDAAAEHLERLALRVAERHLEAPELRLYWLGVAWSVGHDEDLRAQILEEALREGEARVASDPHTAVSLFEFLLFERIDGFPLDPSLRERAEAGTHAALEPIMVSNFQLRFDNRHARTQQDAGVWDPATGMITLDLSAGDPDEIFNTWYYSTLERARPVPGPPLRTGLSLCEDTSEPCVFPLVDVFRTFHRLDAIEAEAISQISADEIGLPIPPERIDPDDEWIEDAIRAASSPSTP
jgi:hypothetical protein